MLISLTELKSYRIEATDGDVGRIDDLLFFRGEWVVRYVAVATEDLDTSPLVDVADIRRLDRCQHLLLVNLSREDIANAPTVDVEQPPDESNEEEAHELHGWPPYWLEEGREVAPMSTDSRVEEPMKNPDTEEFEGPELQRASDLPGFYSVQTDSGEVGTLKDFVVEDETWTIPYIVIDTNSSLQAPRRVLVATDYVQRVDWLGKSIEVLAVNAAAFRVAQETAQYTPGVVEARNEFVIR